MLSLNFFIVVPIEVRGALTVEIKTSHCNNFHIEGYSAKRDMEKVP